MHEALCRSDHEDDEELTAKFVKRQAGSSHLFTFPDQEDTDTVGYDDIVQIIANKNSRKQFYITHGLL